MTTPIPRADFGLLRRENFFDAGECEMLLAELRSAAGAPATVYKDSSSPSAEDRSRRATRLSPSPRAEEFVRGRLLGLKAEAEEHFGVALGGCEQAQFLRYVEGDFFVAHQDGNTGLLRSDRERTRRVSVVVFLNRQSERPEPGAYRGGSLVLTGRPTDEGGLRRLDLRGEAGTLVAFRAETTHEVIPVTGGERYTIVSWFG